MGLDDQLRFGKYKGRQLWLVLKTDLQYIKWLIEEASMNFELDNEAYERYEKELNKQGI